MDFKNVLNKVLPYIGAAATGGVPALVAIAAKEVGEALGVDVQAKPDAIADAVANATPEQIIALRDREMAFKERMQAMGFQNAKDMRELEIKEAQVYVSDTADARSKGDKGVFWLGIAVLITFAATMSASLYGAYQILVGGITLKDVAVVAAVSGFVGTIIGYVAANAQQVISYFFGSSKGSNDKGAAMADAFSKIGHK